MWRTGMEAGSDGLLCFSVCEGFDGLECVVGLDGLGAVDGAALLLPTGVCFTEADGGGGLRADCGGNHELSLLERAAAAAARGVLCTPGVRLLPPPPRL